MNVPESLLASKATSKTLRGAIDSHGELAERDRLQVRAVAKAEHELDVAEAGEVKAGADAIRAGKPMPESHLGEQRARLDEMRREAAALEHAVRDAGQAVKEAVEANRPAWAKAHEGVSDRLRGELVAAVDAFEAADRALREAFAGDSFLSGREQRGVGYVTLTARNDEPYPLADLVAALRHYASGSPIPDLALAHMQHTPGADQRLVRDARRRLGLPTVPERNISTEAAGLTS